MSATATFLKIQYELGKVTDERIRALVGSKLIQSEANEILSHKTPFAT